MARKSTPVVVAEPVASRGPSAETLAFAAKVVDLRDRKGLPWKSVASALGVPYDHNGSSRLRRANTVGGGATVGVRERNVVQAAVAAPRANRSNATKRTPKGTAAKSSGASSGGTPAERRAARNAAAAKTAKPAPKRTRRAAA